jgi:hypothetical protein
LHIYVNDCVISYTLNFEKKYNSYMIYIIRNPIL